MKERVLLLDREVASTGLPKPWLHDGSALEVSSVVIQQVLERYHQHAAFGGMTPICESKAGTIHVRAEH